jgi:ATP-dependent RNA helicase DHX57
LRGIIDRLIAERVENPGLDLEKSDVIKMVVKLIELDGMDA